MKKSVGQVKEITERNEMTEVSCLDGSRGGYALFSV